MAYAGPSLMYVPVPSDVHDFGEPTGKSTLDRFPISSLGQWGEQPSQGGHDDQDSGMINLCML